MSHFYPELWEDIITHSAIVGPAFSHNTTIIPLTVPI